MSKRHLIAIFDFSQQTHIRDESKAVEQNSHDFSRGIVLSGLYL